MNNNIKIIEITKDNQNLYIDKIVELEKKVLNDMIKKGKEGQLFITGKEDILNYIYSKENTVMCAIKEKRVLAATYITKGQQAFTYNDITKYFKFGENYNENIKSQYDEQTYKNIIKQIYTDKVKAYTIARDKVLCENNIKINNISSKEKSEKIKILLEKEFNKNEFHEKSEIRENLNKYMSEIMYDKGKLELYEKFYWLSLQDLTKELYSKNVNISEFSQDIQDYETERYDEFLNLQKYKIHGKSDFDIRKYFSANTNNSIEIDTYITEPGVRSKGLARILVAEGIRKEILKHFKNNTNNEVFLCSTIHKENISSKYVSEFFGLKDNLYVQRRQGRDREVRICRINRNEANGYLNNINKKIAVLYEYNPRKTKITKQDEFDIKKEQLYYEIEQIIKLKKIKKTTGKFSGEIISKKNKIINLQKQILKLENENIRE